LAEIIYFANARRTSSVRKPRTKDSDLVEVFPGVSLADLWRLWASCERAKKNDRPPLMKMM
jgi:hypothetical protein